MAAGMGPYSGFGHISADACALPVLSAANGGAVSLGLLACMHGSGFQPRYWSGPSQYNHYGNCHEGSVVGTCLYSLWSSEHWLACGYGSGRTVVSVILSVAFHVDIRRSFLVALLLLVDPLGYGGVCHLLDIYFLLRLDRAGICCQSVS